jgi:hypothetical protein
MTVPTGWSRVVGVDQVLERYAGERGQRRRDTNKRGHELGCGLLYLECVQVPLSGTLYSLTYRRAAAALGGIPARRRRPLVACRILSPHYIVFVRNRHLLVK